MHRSLTFNQNVVVQGSALLRPYALGFGPIGVANVVLFPWMAGKVGNFGVEAEIQQAFGISTSLPAGRSFNDGVHEYAGGLRYRVPFATSDDLFFSLALGEDAFTFNGPNRSSLATPDTVYHYTRVGTGMHVAISDGVGVSFGGGYRYINNRARGSDLSGRLPAPDGRGRGRRPRGPLRTERDVRSPRRIGLAPLLVRHAFPGRATGSWPAARSTSRSPSPQASLSCSASVALPRPMGALKPLQTEPNGRRHHDELSVHPPGLTWLLPDWPQLRHRPYRKALLEHLLLRHPVASQCRHL